jgi:putative transposase
MKKSRFNDEQIVQILREADKEPVSQVPKKHGVSEQTLYTWKKRFGSIEESEVKCLKGLEVENSRLKKILAEQDLQIDILKEINEKSGERTDSAPAGYPRHQARVIHSKGLCAFNASSFDVKIYSVPTCVRFSCA